MERVLRHCWVGRNRELRRNLPYELAVIEAASIDLATSQSVCIDVSNQNHALIEGRKLSEHFVFVLQRCATMARSFHHVFYRRSVVRSPTLEFYSSGFKLSEPKSTFRKAFRHLKSMPAFALMWRGAEEN